LSIQKNCSLERILTDEPCHDRGRIADRRSRGHSIFITDWLIRDPEQQARFFAATIAQVSVSAHQT
jgi:hypothetical protein